LKTAPADIAANAATAGNAYFGAWSAHVGCRFAERDADRIPDHWRIFAARGSRLHAGGRTPRKAPTRSTRF
jgi:hypothetical protein